MPHIQLQEGISTAFHRIVFGNDIFISYSRADGATYAAGLAGKLAADRFATRLDQWGTQPGEKVPDEIIRAVRSSSVLVIVGTKASYQSLAVEQEITAFLATKRYIVPVDVDGDIDHAVWWRLLKGLPVTRGIVRDPGDDKVKSTGDISPAVVSRIEKLFEYTKRDHRLRLFSAVVITSLAFLLAAAVYAGNQALRANRSAEKAQERQTSAEQAARNANEKERAAHGRQVAAEALAARANVAAKNAQEAEKTAKSQAAAAELRKSNAERKERRANFNLQASTALVNGDPLRAWAAAEQSARIEDTPTARLLLTQILEEGLPLELRGFDRIRDVAVNPIDSNMVAAVGISGGRSRLMLWNIGTGARREVDALEFYAIEFSSDGRSLYAAALTKIDAEEGPAMGRRVDREVSLIRYDTALQKTATAAFGRIDVPGEEPSKSYDVRDVMDLTFDQSGRRLLMAGYAAPGHMGFVDNPMPFHWRAWASPDDLQVTSVIDTDHELSAVDDYRGRVVLLSETNNIILDGTNELYLLDMQTRQRVLIGKHAADIAAYDASPHGSRIAAAGGDSRVSVFTRDGDRWRQEIVDIGGDAEIDQVRFVDEDRIVVGSDDLTLQVITLKGGKNRDVILDGHLTWKEPRRKSFIGHSGEIRNVTVSGDGRWISSASADRTVRLWSTIDDRRRVLRGSRLGILSARFSTDSRRLYTAGLDGLLRVYDVEPPHEGVIQIHPGDSQPEPRISDHNLTQGGGLTIAILLDHWGFAEKLSWNAKGELEARTHNRVTTRWDRQYRLLGTSQEPQRTIADAERPEIRRWIEVPPNRRPVIHDDIAVDEKREAAAVLSPDGRHLLWFSDGDNSLYIWDRRAAGRPVRMEMVDGEFVRSSYGEEITHKLTKFSSGRWAAFPLRFDHRYAFAVVDLVRMQVRVMPGDFNPLAFDLSPRGDVAMGARNGEVAVSTADGEVRALARHGAKVEAVAFSPDGEWIGTAAADRTIRVWSAAGGDFQEHRLLNPAVAVVFSKDSRQLLAASGRAIHAFYVPSGRIEAFLAVRRPENITDMARASLRRSQASDPPPRTRKPLIFLVAQKPTKSSRDQAIRSALGGITPTEARLRTLVAIATNESYGRNRRIEAVLELHLYGDRIEPWVHEIASALRGDMQRGRLQTTVLDLLRRLGPRASAGLVSAIRESKEPKLRRELTDALSDLAFDSPPTRAALQSLQRDGDGDVRIAAALGFAQFSTDVETLAILGEALLSSDARADEAAKRLQMKQEPGARWLLRGLDATSRRYADPPAELAQKALAAMGREVVPLLRRSITETSGEQRVARVRVLAAIGKGVAVEALPDLMSLLRIEPYDSKHDSGTISAALSAIGAIGPEASAAIPAIIDVLLDPQKPQLEAAFVFDRIGPAAVEPLAAVLPATQGRTSGYVAYALGELGAAAAKAAPALCAVLAREHNADLAKAIGKIGPAAAGAAACLVNELRSSRGYDRLQVLDAIEAISGDAETIVPAIVALLDEESRQQPPPQYRITPDVLTALRGESIPPEVLVSLERLYDVMDRPLEYFEPIVGRWIGPEKMQRFGQTILAKAEVRDPHRCDEHRLFATAGKILRAFGKAAAPAAATLQVVRDRLPLCADIASEMDNTLKAIQPMASETTSSTP